MKKNLGKSQLTGKRILIVEDEYLIADEMVEAFERQGAQIIGPAATLQEALALMTASTALDAAVLDINLRGEMVFPVADALGEKRIPYVFATGYDNSVLPKAYQEAIRCEKPVNPEELAAALF